MRSTKLIPLFCSIAAICSLTSVRVADAATPDWARAQVTVATPEHDEETNAVLLYSETSLTVVDATKVKTVDRRVYRILRPDGESFGTVGWPFGHGRKITSIRGWTIPTSGKDFETRDKDVADTSYIDIDGGELMTDLHMKRLHIPAATPGNIVAYEVLADEQPDSLNFDWDFQETEPVVEARYSLQVPAGWSYKSTWLNHADTAPVTSGTGQSQWTLKDLQPVRIEASMPPWRRIAGRLVVSLQPPTGTGGFQSWREIGTWYTGLTEHRRDASPAIKQKVQELTASESTVFGKMRALAGFVQRDIRYVAIELGIGGYQPHPAVDVFSNRYGDCKDKVTLLSSMLKEIGIESHYVIINTMRGAVTEVTPPNLGFNHVILAIELPAATSEADLLPSVVTHKKLGRLMYFDPTQTLVPFGRLPGYLQANYGMLVTSSDGGELVQLPRSLPESNGVKRSAKLALDENGTLKGDVDEVWSGEGAVERRSLLRAARQDIDQIKPVESMLSHSLATFQITKASVGNGPQTDRPLEWHYSLEAEHYAKNAGDLLLIRPRVMGNEGSGLLETKKPRVHPIEFDAPERDTDVFEITLPQGYTVDELPPPVNLDLGFASYGSKTEVLMGRVLRYTRTLEIKEVSVPVARADDLKRFYRAIENDERMSAVLKRASP